jgi:hypothetical protein
MDGMDGDYVDRSRFATSERKPRRRGHRDLWRGDRRHLSFIELPLRRPASDAAWRHLGSRLPSVTTFVLLCVAVGMRRGGLSELVHS